MVNGVPAANRNLHELARMGEPGLSGRVAQPDNRVLSDSCSVHCVPRQPGPDALGLLRTLSPT